MPDDGTLLRGVALRNLSSDFAVRNLSALPVAPATLEATPVRADVLAEIAPRRIRLPLREPEPELPLAFEPQLAVARPIASQLLLRPDLLRIGAILQPEQTESRESLDVPVCPQADVTDTVLFEDPKTPETRFYLPRYRVRRAGDQELIRLTRQDTTWQLIIELEAFAAPELGDVGAAGPLTHTLSVALQYQVGDGQFDRPFEISDTPEGHKRAVLGMADDTERNVVYSALTTEAFRTRLIIHRLISVAVSEGQAAAPVADRPAIEAIRRRRPIFADRDMAREILEFERQGRFAEVDAMEVEAAPPPPPPAPAFRKVTVTLDHHERSSFVFPRALYDYVFSEVEGGTASVAFRPYLVAFAGRQHRYYRDPSDRRVFHYLPDAFKLARQPQAPHAPTLLLRFLPGSEGIDDMRAQLDYIAIPYVDPDRLEHAAAALPALLGDDPLHDGQVPAFKILSPPPETMRLLLALGGGAPGAVRDAAQIELSSAVRERLTLSLAEFQSLWEALFSSTPVLFQGSIEVRLSDTVEQIPFIGRMDHLAGSVLDSSEQFLTGGEVAVTLTNGCESPVTVGQPEAVVLGADGPVACTVAEPDPSQPISLAPGAQVRLRLVAQAEVRAPTDALVSFATLDVEPDKGALYQAILDPAGPLEFLRGITVRGKHLFDAAPAEDPLVAVLVEFERGSTAELTPGTSDGHGLVRLPLADLVLGRISSADIANASYRYRVRLVHQRSGQQRGEWVEDTTDILYPSAPQTALAPTPVGPAPGQ